MRVRLRAVALPEGWEREVYVDGDRITFHYLPNAETVVDGGWILPGLVDVHTHMGSEQPADGLDESLLRRHAEAHRDAGVTLLRSPGASGFYPSWLDQDPTLPRVRSAGPWLAAEGGFFERAGLQLPVDELPSAAEEHARVTGWCKVILDWSHDVDGARRYEPTVPPEVLAEIVERTHAVGGRVAAHSQHPDGGAAAVVARVDSLEHGMHLPLDRLDEMAASGTALVPTLLAFQRMQAERDLTQPAGRFLSRGTESAPGAHPRCARGRRIDPRRNRLPALRQRRRGSLGARRRRTSPGGCRRCRVVDGTSLPRPSGDRGGCASRSRGLR